MNGQIDDWRRRKLRLMTEEGGWECRVEIKRQTEQNRQKWPGHGRHSKRAELVHLSSSAERIKKASERGESHELTIDMHIVRSCQGSEF